LHRASCLHRSCFQADGHCRYLASGTGLVELHAVSRQDYDNAVATLQQAQADVGSGEAVVRTAAINLAYTKVYSPISGRTGRSSLTEGALVTANQPSSLVTITQLDPVYVDVTQPTTTLVRLKRELASGQLRSAGSNKAAASLFLEDSSAYEHPGSLQFSEVTVDQGTSSVNLRAIFPNPNDLLLPGMFVHARISLRICRRGRVSMMRDCWPSCRRACHQTCSRTAPTSWLPSTICEGQTPISVQRARRSCRASS
jgi:RND family efflux transporter MFP subunit